MAENSAFGPSTLRFAMEKAEDVSSMEGHWPELHGGPEGHYHREASGRWRAFSQEPLGTQGGV